MKRIVSSISATRNINLAISIFTVLIFFISTFFDASIVFIGSACVLLSLLILVFFLLSKRALDNGFNELKKMALDISNGDLDARADLEKENEFGEIARDLNKALRRFRRITADVGSAAGELNEIAVSTSRFANKAQKSSVGLSDQSSRLASTLEEI